MTAATFTNFPDQTVLLKQYVKFEMIGPDGRGGPHDCSNIRGIAT